MEGRSIREGDAYRVRVLRVSDYGAHVTLPNGMPALVHISEWAHHRVRDIHEVAREGMELDVLCKGRDARGQIVLSRKALLRRSVAEREHRAHARPRPAAAAAGRHHGGDGDSGGGGGTDGAAGRAQSEEAGAAAAAAAGTNASTSQQQQQNEQQEQQQHVGS